MAVGWWKEKTGFCKLSSDLHMNIPSFMLPTQPPHTHTQEEEGKEIKINVKHCIALIHSIDSKTQEKSIMDSRVTNQRYVRSDVSATNDGICLFFEPWSHYIGRLSSNSWSS